LPQLPDKLTDPEEAMQMRAGIATEAKRLDDA
jgi:hypothetical protein